MGGSQGSSTSMDTTTGATPGYQGQTFGEGLPIIGSLLDGASKNPGAGSTQPNTLSFDANPMMMDLQTILGKLGGP